MHKNKTDQTVNGELLRRQHRIIPKGKRSHYIKELRAWIFVDEDLALTSARDIERKYLKRYRAGLPRLLINY